MPMMALSQPTISPRISCAVLRKPKTCRLDQASSAQKGNAPLTGRLWSLATFVGSLSMHQRSEQSHALRESSARAPGSKKQKPHPEAQTSETVQPTPIQCFAQPQVDQHTWSSFSQSNTARTGIKTQQHLSQDSSNIDC